MINGCIVLRDGHASGVNEAEIFAELEEIMHQYRHDFNRLRSNHAPAFPYLLDANRTLAAMDLKMNRFIGRASAFIPGQESSS